MAFPFYPCIETLHISLNKKNESRSQLNFNELEISFYLGTLFWSVMLNSIAVFLLHMNTRCVF